MRNPLRNIRNLIRAWLKPQRQGTINRKPTFLRPWLESLEDRLAPASLAVNAQPQIDRLGSDTVRDLAIATGVAPDHVIGSAAMGGALGAGTGNGTFNNLADNNNGTYTATFTGTTPGTIPITGTIEGQNITSTPPTITVTGASTTTTLSSVPSIYGNAASFTATVLAGASAVSTGTVTFKEGDTILAGPVGLDADGHASFSMATLSAAGSPHTITACYSGTTDFAASNGSASQTVNPRPITVSANALSKLFGAADPALTYQISTGSLVAGDAFTGALTRDAGEAIGTYAIQQGTLALNANYTLIFGSGLFNVSGPVDQLVITGLSSTSVTAGNPVTFTVTAEDSTGRTETGYTGTVQLTSTDSSALYNGTGLPGTYTFVAGDAGVHSFAVTLETADSRTITVTDQANHSFTATTGPITVNPNPFSKFVVSVLGGSTVVAGIPFLFTVQATDQAGNPVSSYNGPTTVTTTAGPVDAQSNFPITGALNSSGFGFFQGNLKTAGSYTLTTTGASFSGTSGAITVAAASTNYFTVAAPPAAVTGTPINVTVTAFDQFGNITPGYNGFVTLTSNDPGAAVLVASYKFSTGAGNDNGTHTFSVALNSGGSRKISASDLNSTKPTITGTSAAITTRGLIVTNLTPTADGFTVTFNKAFVPADLALFGPTLTRLPDVTLVGQNVGAIHGTLLIDPANQSLTFKATSSYLQLLNGASNTSVVLPDDVYTVTLVSGSGGQGFLDALGLGLDGLNNGTRQNFHTTFVTHFQANATPVLGIPDFARGPDDVNPIVVPNDTASGIPITFYNANNLTDVTFTLIYNPLLLNIAAGFAGPGSDATEFHGAFTLGSNSGGVASFTFHDNFPQSGTVVLGDIRATVPTSSARTLYQVNEQLQLVNIVVHAGLTPILGTRGANGVHVNAYFGDVNADHGINGVDGLLMDNISQGRATGFSAYVQMDPVIVSDVGGDAAVDSAAVSGVDAYQHQLSMQIPTPPGLGGITSPNAADPTLSLSKGVRSEERGDGSNASVLTPVITVMLDHPHPEGSTGMTEAVLALSYDPTVLSVSASDITLGSLPSLGTSWHLSSVVDAATGKIGIELYSMTPITSPQAGSLVNIGFHVLPSTEVTATAVQLVDAVSPNGQYFGTVVADAQSALTLSQGIDRLMVLTGVDTATPAVLARMVNTVTVTAFQGRILTDGRVHSDGTDPAGTTFLLIGSATNDGLTVLSNDTVAGETVHAVPFGLAVNGALAFQTNEAPQLVVDKVFAESANDRDDFSDFGLQ